MDRRGFLAGAAAVTGIMPAMSRGAARARDLRVMSFNVRLPVASDGPDRWEARQDLLVDTVLEAAPDIMGTQELWKIQGDRVVARLPDYSWFGRDRRGGHDDEHMGLFFRHAQWQVVESGDFWLSDTPDVPGSISWGHPYPRMATWGLFERVADRRRLYVVNTHLPYREEDGAAREKGAARIAQWIAARKADIPVVLTGDFNTGPDSAPHRLLTASLRDAWESAAVRIGPAGTFHGFKGVPGKRIDWVMARGLVAQRVETITANRAGRYPSDHFPVVVDYRWA